MLLSLIFINKLRCNLIVTIFVQQLVFKKINVMKLRRYGADVDFKTVWVQVDMEGRTYRKQYRKIYRIEGY